MHYEGQLTADDLAGSYHLHVGTRAPAWSAPRWVLVCVLAFVIFRLAPIPGTWLLKLIIPLLLLSGVLLVVFPAVVRRRLRRLHAGNRALHSPFRTRVDADGFETSSDTDRARRAWADFSRWREDSRYFLLYESSYSYRVIPKRVLGSPERVTELPELFQRHLGAPA